MAALRLARDADMAAMLQIVSQAQAFLAENGVDQWQDGYPSEEVLRGDIRLSQGYVYEIDGEVQAIASLVFTGEPTYARIEGAWGTKPPYVTIHRLALRAECRGTGVSGALMGTIEALSREQGVMSARIDTHRDNRAMQGMLQKNGYARRGVIYLADGAERIAFDKTL